MAAILIYYETRNGKKYWRGEIILGYDDKGKPIRKTASSYQKSTVISKLKKYEEDYKGLDLSMDFQGTVQDLFRTWIFTFKKVSIQGSSFAKYEQCYRLRIENTTLGLMDVKEVNKIHIQGFINQIRATDSIDMAKQTLIYLSSFFTYLIDEGAIHKNPCKRIIVKEEVKPDEKYKAYSKDDQQKIIEALDLLDPVEMMIYMAFATGLRRGELLALTWDDIKDGIVDVNKKYGNFVTYGPDGKAIWERKIGPLKTSTSYRQVPLPTKVQQVLRDYKLELLKLQMLNIQGYKRNNLVFPNEQGEYQNINRPTRRLKSVCKKAGVEYISLHATRHSYITRLFELGVDPKTIQRLAGHKNIKTTLDVYTHTNKERKEEAVEKLSAVL